MKVNYPKTRPIIGKIYSFDGGKTGKYEGIDDCIHDSTLKMHRFRESWSCSYGFTHLPTDLKLIK